MFRLGGCRAIALCTQQRLAWQRAVLCGRGRCCMAEAHTGVPVAEQSTVGVACQCPRGCAAHAHLMSILPCNPVMRRPPIMLRGPTCECVLFPDLAVLAHPTTACLVVFVSPPQAFTHMHAPGRDGGEALHIYGQAGQANALRYLRTLVIDQGPQLQVFNCCFFPDPAYDLPAFGADFVTMPRGSLAALDFQPLGNRPATVEAYVSRLQPLRARFHTAFPEGGPMPAEATEFFSAAKIWTRFGNAAEVLPTLLQAFEAYLEAYVSLVNSTPPLRDPAEVDRLREGQHRYLSYRAEKVATLSLLPVSCTYGALSALLPACLSVYRMGCFFVGDATGQAWGFQPPATFSCLRLLPRFLL
eukprot:jgi/Mesvir1/22786/Mv14174-RA.2